MMKINGETVSNVANPRTLSLNANKAHKFVITVIRAVEFYAWTILLTEGIDSFKLRNQEGKKISQWIAQKTNNFV